MTRRYRPVETIDQDHGILVMADIEYVWTESGEVGDTTRVGIALGIRDGLISSWELMEHV